MILSQALFVTGMMLLLHAAYNCLHYRSLLLLLEDDVDAVVDFTTTTTATRTSTTNASPSPLPSIPVDVCMELFVSFWLILISECLRPESSLRPVVAAGGSLMTTKTTTTVPTSGGKDRFCYRPIQAPAYRTRDFDIYETRGQAM